MLSNRIKLARQANRLSLQQLADSLSDSGDEITRAALSNYENNKSVPQPAMLERLAHELGVPAEFFRVPDWDNFSVKLFSAPDLVPLRMQELTSYIQIELERYINLDSLLNIELSWKVPEHEVFYTYDPVRVETLSQRIRSEWNMGTWTISSVCTLLETQGIYLLSIPSQFNIESLSGYELSTKRPFIFYTPNAFLDEFRFDLIRELGRFFIDASPACEESVLNHFARAMLMPSASMGGDFGENRTKISYDEITIAKQKYGISRRNIVQRLRELNIVDEKFYTDFFLYLRQHNFLWRDSNMSTPLHIHEAPMMYNMKYARAVEEGLLQSSESKFF